MWDKIEDKFNVKGGYCLLFSLLIDVLVLNSVYDLYISLFIWNKVEFEGYSLIVCWDMSDSISIKYIGLSCESYFLINIDFDNILLLIFDVLVIYDDE